MKKIAAIGQGAPAVAIAPAQAGLIQQLVGQLRVILRPVVGHPGFVEGRIRRRRRLRRRGQAEVDEVVDFFAVDGHGHRLAEADILEDGAHRFVGMRQVEHHAVFVAAVVGNQGDAVAAVLGAIDIGGVAEQLAPAEMAEFAGDGFQVLHFQVLDEDAPQAIGIGQLVAGGIDLVEVGVALEVFVAEAILADEDKGIQGRRIGVGIGGGRAGIQVGAQAGVDQLRPVLVALFGGQLVGRPGCNRYGIGLK